MGRDCELSQRGLCPWIKKAPKVNVCGLNLIRPSENLQQGLNSVDKCSFFWAWWNIVPSFKCSQKFNSSTKMQSICSQEPVQHKGKCMRCLASEVQNVLHVFGQMTILHFLDNQLHVCLQATCDWSNQFCVNWFHSVGANQFFQFELKLNEVCCTNSTTFFVWSNTQAIQQTIQFLFFSESNSEMSFCLFPKAFFLTMQQMKMLRNTCARKSFEFEKKVHVCLHLFWLKHQLHCCSSSNNLLCTAELQWKSSLWCVVTTWKPFIPAKMNFVKKGWSALVGTNARKPLHAQIGCWWWGLCSEEKSNEKRVRPCFLFSPNGKENRCCGLKGVNGRNSTGKMQLSTFLPALHFTAAISDCWVGFPWGGATCDRKGRQMKWTQAVNIVEGAAEQNWWFPRTCALECSRLWLDDVTKMPFFHFVAWRFHPSTLADLLLNWWEFAFQSMVPAENTGGSQQVARNFARVFARNMQSSSDAQP